MKILIIIVLFLLMGAFLIISNQNLALAKSENAYKFGELYYEWMKKLFLNFKSISGDFVKSSWLPD